MPGRAGRRRRRRPLPLAAGRAKRRRRHHRPTLADVALLTRDSDYTRFVAPGVDTGVKNAALKKLFSDPHFNVMDGLDTYIDDYGMPDPLPAACCGRWCRSPFLGLFDDRRAKTPLPAGCRRTSAAPTATPSSSWPRPPPMKTLICDCNRTMPLDRPALAKALAQTPGASAEGIDAPLTGLCRREAGQFQRAAVATAAQAEPLLVACTQESRLFTDLNAATEGSAPGWTCGRSTSSTCARPAAGRAMRNRPRPSWPR